MNESIPALWSPGMSQLEVALMVFSYSSQSAASHPGVLPTLHRPPRGSDPHPVPEHPGQWIPTKALGAICSRPASSSHTAPVSYLGTGKGFPGQPATPGVLSFCIPRGSVSALWVHFLLVHELSPCPSSQSQGCSEEHHIPSHLQPAQNLRSLLTSLSTS